MSCFCPQCNQQSLSIPTAYGVTPAYACGDCRIQHTRGTIITHIVRDTVCDRTYYLGTYDECKAYLRSLLRLPGGVDHLNIVSTDTGRCVSWVL